MRSPVIRDDIRLGPKLRYIVPLAKPAPAPAGFLETATMVSGAAVRAGSMTGSADAPPPDGAGRTWAMAHLKRRLNP